MEVEEHLDEDLENSKKIRRRKKNLYNSILKQMEFYFSDSNIKKDRFIGQLIQENPYVDLSTFLKFNKIASLTSKVEEIAFALEKSQFLKLSDDKKSVRRTTPIVEKENEDDCTIYIERLPEDTTHDWLQEIFSIFGQVDYVSLPKYKHNKRPKGFAFIEFGDVDTATNALDYFELIGCKLTTEMSPNQLASIITFDQENRNESQINEDNKRKRKLDSEEDSVVKKAKVEEVKGSEEELEEKKDEEEMKEKTGEEGETGENEGVEEGKKKRKRKKHRKSHKDELKQLALQVLSKKEWKQLRNKYLNMQRIKMKTLKEHLFRHRHYNRIPEENKDSDQKPRFKYTPNCIIQFHIPPEFTDIKKLKTDIKVNPGVEYIDVFPGKEIGYIRFCDSEKTNDFLNSNFFDTSKILTGKDEESYWDKIMKDRDVKLNKVPNKKVRGREKLLKKAEHELGKHIRFDN